MRPFVLVIVGLVVLETTGPTLIALAHAALPLSILVVIALLALLLIRYVWYRT